jgi:UDP-glucuronate 4-epimerase
MYHFLITGGVGFIGHHVCERILSQGHRVTVFDDFSDSPYPRSMKQQNRDALGARFGLRFEVIEGSIASADGLAKLFDRPPWDYVIHLAGLAGVRPSFADPGAYARVNIEGHARLLQLAIERKIKRFVFASSSSIYGSASFAPVSEDLPAITPQSPYAASKRAMELLSQALCLADPALHCTALRFFTVYGPRQRPEMAIAKFCRAALLGEPITVFGDGSMQRDFTHVSDIVDGILAAIDRAPCGYRVYNLGSNHPVTLHELLAQIQSLVTKPLKIEHASVPLGDVESTFANIDRARSELQWQPKTPLREGLATVIDWLSQPGQAAARY